MVSGCNPGGGGAQKRAVLRGRGLEELGSNGDWEGSLGRQVQGVPPINAEHSPAHCIGRPSKPPKPASLLCQIPPKALHPHV